MLFPLSLSSNISINFQTIKNYYTCKIILNPLNLIRSYHVILDSNSRWFHNELLVYSNMMLGPHLQFEIKLKRHVQIHVSGV